MIVTDEKILRQVSKETTLQECSEQKVFEKLTKALLESETPGLGLAAIQVGIPLRASVILKDNNIMMIINPKIVHAKNQMKFNNEGCLSMPGQYIHTRRFSDVYIEYEAIENDELLPFVYLVLLAFLQFYFLACQLNR